MKRLVVAAILLMSAVVGAQADSEYANTRKQWRGDDALQADAQYCDQRFGVVLDGAVTPAAYKKCMLGRGWRYRRATHPQTWIDPETGDTCHDILGGPDRPVRISNEARPLLNQRDFERSAYRLG
jgi:hypothetical protein